MKIITILLLKNGKKKQKREKEREREGKKRRKKGTPLIEAEIAYI